MKCYCDFHLLPIRTYHPLLCKLQVRRSRESSSMLLRPGQTTPPAMMSWEEDDVSSLEATPRALKDATPLPFESPKARQRALRAIHGAPHVKTMPTIVPAVLPKQLSGRLDSYIHTLAH